MNFCELDMSLFWFGISLWGYYGMSVSQDVRKEFVSNPGDVIIGGLFPVHKTVNRTDFLTDCSDIDVTMLLQAQAMIYAIEKINESPMLPDVFIGYKMYDTCGDVFVAARGTLKLIEQSGGDPNGGDAVEMCPSLEETPGPGEEGVMAVIGERDSEVSTVVARLMALPMIAQISYGSTSELLSSKLKFPTFLRTVSSDKHQTMAMFQLVKEKKWDIVGVIGSNDEYGKYGSETLIDLLNGKGTCIAFKEILPDYFTQDERRTRIKLDEIFMKMNANPTEAIVIFTKQRNVKAILEEAIKRGVRRTWIASDSWSTSTEISGLNNIESIGRVIGFTSKRHEIPGFKDYIYQLISQERQNTSGSFLLNYMSQKATCPHALEEDYTGNSSLCDDSGQKCLLLHCLKNYIDHDESYSIYLAVNVIAHALKSLLECSHDRCKRNTTFTARELLDEIQKVNTTVNNNTHIFFDESGDPNIGQDILEWKIEGLKVNIISIGEYETSGTIKLYSNFSMDNYSETNCSKFCDPGYELRQLNNSCCKTCHPCSDKYFSKGGGSECEVCPSEQYASPQKDGCLNKEITYLMWTDGIAITMAVFVGLGVILLILVAALFAVHRNTPIVKAAGGNLSFLAMLSLLACFCSVAVGLSEPTEVTCKISTPLFLMAFTICIACILANLLQIYVGFRFHVKLDKTLKRFNKPAMIVSVCAGVQGVVCALWLTLYPPHKVISYHHETKIIITCHYGSWTLSLVMYIYVGFLSLVCFIFAYKGRRLPDLYKNARYVTVSMLVYLVVCILFIPFSLAYTHMSRQGVFACALLVSTYSVFLCHFAPKCYIIVFKRDMNNENAITEYIRNHYQKQTITVVSS